MTYDEVINRYAELPKAEQVRIALFFAPKKKTQRAIAKDLGIHESLVCIYLKGKRHKNLTMIENEVKKLYL